MATLPVGTRLQRMGPCFSRWIVPVVLVGVFVVLGICAAALGGTFGQRLVSRLKILLEIVATGAGIISAIGSLFGAVYALLSAMKQGDLNEAALVQGEAAHKSHENKRAATFGSRSRGTPTTGVARSALPTECDAASDSLQGAMEGLKNLGIFSYYFGSRNRLLDLHRKILKVYASEATIELHLPSSTTSTNSVPLPIHNLAQTAQPPVLSVQTITNLRALQSDIEELMHSKWTNATQRELQTKKGALTAELRGLNENQRIAWLQLLG